MRDCNKSMSRGAVVGGVERSSYQYGREPRMRDVYVQLNFSNSVNALCYSSNFLQQTLKPFLPVEKATSLD